MAAPIVTSTQAIEPGHEVGPYVLTREIGKGSFAVVYQGKIRPPQSTFADEKQDEDQSDAAIAGPSSERRRTELPVTRVAIKIVTRKKLTQKLLENLEGEISILRTVRHANIVELLDCLKAPNYIYLVMQYCRMGDLSVFIRTRRRPSLPTTDQQSRSDTLVDPFEEAMDKEYPHPHDGGLHADMTRSFLAQLASAIQFMRVKNIVHRDIKPQNLLLQEPEPTLIAAGHPTYIPQLKVADFGFARHLEAASLAETLCGSPLYMAPEILRYEKYDAKADLWSVGAVLFEMCVGKPPFRASNHVELLRRIERGEDKFKFPDERSDDSLRRDYAKRVEEGKEKAPFQRPHTVDPDIKQLIRNLLKRRPIERMTFEDFFLCDVLQDYKQRTSASLTGSVGGSSALPSPSPSPSSSSIVARRVAPAVPSDVSPHPAPATIGQRRRSQASEDLSPTQAPTSSPFTPIRHYFAPKYVVGGSKTTLTQPPTKTKKPERSITVPEQSEPVAQAAAKPSRIVRPKTNEANDCEPSSLEDNVLETPGSSLSHLPATATQDANEASMGKRTPPPSIGGGMRERRASAYDDDRGYVLVDKRNVDAQAVAAAEEANARPRQSGGGGGWSPLGVVRRPSQLSRLASLGGTISPLSGIAAAASAAMQHAPAGQAAAVSPRTASPVAIATAIPSRQSPAPPTPPIAKSQSPLNPRFSSTPPNAPFVVPASARKPSFSRRTSNNAESAARPTLPRPSLSPLSPSSGLPPAPSQSAPSGGGFVPVSPSSQNALVAPPSSSSLSRPGSSSSQTAAPSSALARAISMASIRLFGVPTGMSMRGADVRRSLRMGLGTGALLSSSPSQALDVQPYSSVDVAEQNLLSLLHEYGQKSFVLSEFADARLATFFAEGPHQSNFLDRRHGSNSSLHSMTGGGAGGAANTSSRKSSLTNNAAAVANNASGQASSSPTPSTSSSSQVETAASEAYVLYVRSLSFLQRGMDAAREFVEARSMDSASRYASNFREKDGALVAAGSLSSSSQDVHDALHWLRAKFNDGVERAKFARNKSSEDLPESAQYIDKMIFDEALEVARRAALEELENNRVGDRSWNAERCLLAYETACTMLQGLLDPADEQNKDFSASALGTIEKFISSISKRMASIQLKYSNASFAGPTPGVVTGSPPSIVAI